MSSESLMMNKKIPTEIEVEMVVMKPMESFTINGSTDRLI